MQEIILFQNAGKIPVIWSYRGVRSNRTGQPGAEQPTTQAQPGAATPPGTADRTKKIFSGQPGKIRWSGYIRV